MSDEATVLPEVLARRMLSAELAAQGDSDIAQALVGAPDGTDFASGCGVQRAIVNKDPGRWASICDAAISLLEDPLSKLVAALLLEKINGLRRTKEWIATEVVVCLDRVRQIIDQLPESPRRDRLTELHAYHGALVYYAGGEYVKAVECLRVSARFSKDEPSRLWNLYLASYYEFIATIAANESVQKIDAMVVLVNQASTQLLDVLDLENPLHVQWKFNILYHHIRMLWYVLSFGLAFYFERLSPLFHQRLPFDQVPAFMDAQGFLIALALLGKESCSAMGLHAAQLIATYGVEPDARADSFLLCAKIALLEREASQAKMFLSSLIGLKINGGHLAKAVGARMLAELEAGK